MVGTHLPTPLTLILNGQISIVTLCLRGDEMVEVIALSFFVCAGLEGERGISVQRWVAGGWGECGLPRRPAPRSLRSGVGRCSLFIGHFFVDGVYCGDNDEGRVVLLVAGGNYRRLMLVYMVR